MTLTKRVLDLLADGKPRSSVQIMEALGVTYTQLNPAIMGILRVQSVTSTPVVYSITAEGRARAATVTIANRSIEERRKIKNDRMVKWRAGRAAAEAKYKKERAQAKESAKRLSDAQRKKALAVAASDLVSRQAAECTVQMAMRTRPVLESVWGAR